MRLRAALARLPAARRGRARPIDAMLNRPNLVGGLGVLVAVTALLQVLRKAVGQVVDTHVTDVWTAGSRLAQNTSASHMLRTTMTLSAELVEELERHAGTRKETTS